MVGPADLCDLCSLAGSKPVGDGCLNYGSLLEHISITLEIIAGREHKLLDLQTHLSVCLPFVSPGGGNW